MKPTTSIQQLRQKRASARRREKAALRTGKVTPDQLQKRNSWFPARPAITFDAKKLATALSKAP